MKMIEAIMQPFKMGDVKQALVKLGVEGMTVTDVQGYGHQKPGRETYKGIEYTATFVPKMKIELVVEDHLVQGVVDTITRSAKTDGPGDGRIFVLDLVSAVRIKTGPMCEPALAQ